MRTSRRFSINYNAIADILFQGLDDLPLPSLSLSRSSNRSTFVAIIYGETRQLSVPEYGESMSIDPRSAYISEKKEEENETTHGSEEGIFLE